MTTAGKVRRAKGRSDRLMTATRHVHVECEVRLVSNWPSCLCGGCSASLGTSPRRVARDMHAKGDS